MKYLLKWKFSRPKNEEERQARLKNNETRLDEEKYGKVLYPSHMVGNYRGFTLVECDFEQLTNRLTLSPWLDYEVYPMIPATTMQEKM